MIKGKGRFLKYKTKTGKRNYDKFFIYVPTEVARDGLFPFEPGEEINILIEAAEKRLLITKKVSDS